MVLNPKEADMADNPPGPSTPPPQDPRPDLSAEVEKWKAMARKHENEAKKHATRLNEIEAANQSEQEKVLAAARKEAEEATRAEISATMNRRIVRAEVKAVAGGLLADPEDAVRLLDLDEFSVDEDGDVNPDSVKKALDDLLKSKPYLAANGQRARGSADGGPRPEPTITDDSPRGLIAAGLAANEQARSRR